MSECSQPLSNPPRCPASSPKPHPLELSLFGRTNSLTFAQLKPLDDGCISRTNPSMGDPFSSIGAGVPASLGGGGLAAIGRSFSLDLPGFPSAGGSLRTQNVPSIDDDEDMQGLIIMESRRVEAAPGCYEDPPAHLSGPIFAVKQEDAEGAEPGTEAAEGTLELSGATEDYYNAGVTARCGARSPTSVLVAPKKPRTKHGSRHDTTPAGGRPGPAPAGKRKPGGPLRDMEWLVPYFDMPIFEAADSLGVTVAGVKRLLKEYCAWRQAMATTEALFVLESSAQLQPAASGEAGEPEPEWYQAAGATRPGEEPGEGDASTSSWTTGTRQPPRRCRKAAASAPPASGSLGVRGARGGTGAAGVRKGGTAATGRTCSWPYRKLRSLDAVLETLGVPRGREPAGATCTGGPRRAEGDKGAAAAAAPSAALQSDVVRRLASTRNGLWGRGEDAIARAVADAQAQRRAIILDPGTPMDPETKAMRQLIFKARHVADRA